MYKHHFSLQITYLNVSCFYWISLSWPLCGLGDAILSALTSRQLTCRSHQTDDAQGRILQPQIILFFIIIAFAFHRMNEENKMLKWITAAVIVGNCTDALQFAFWSFWTLWRVKLLINKNHIMVVYLKCEIYPHAVRPHQSKLAISMCWFKTFAGHLKFSNLSIYVVCHL